MAGTGVDAAASPRKCLNRAMRVLGRLFSVETPFKQKSAPELALGSAAVVVRWA